MMPHNKASEVLAVQVTPLGEAQDGDDAEASATTRPMAADAQASLEPAAQTIEAAALQAAGEQQSLGPSSASESSEEEDEGMSLALSGGISNSTLELFSLVSSLRQQIDLQLLQLMKKNN
jgi:hypothetical protein